MADFSDIKEKLRAARSCARLVPHAATAGLAPSLSLPRKAWRIASRQASEAT